MKVIIFILTCLFWMGALYYGYTLIVTKTMNSAPNQKKSDEDVSLEKQQKQKAQENLKKKKQLMEDRQRSLRYYQGRQ